MAWQDVGPLTGAVAHREEDATVIFDVGSANVVEALPPGEDTRNNTGKWLILFSKDEEFDDQRLQGLASYGFGRVLHFGEESTPTDIMLAPQNTAMPRALKPSQKDLKKFRDRYSSD